MRVFAAFAVMILFGFAADAQEEGALFSSVQSGSWQSPDTWEVVSGQDSDGIPDADDSLRITAGHQVAFQGKATGPQIHNIEIEAGASFDVNSEESQWLWTTGRILVEGSLNIEGPHELIFDGTEQYLSGIRVMPGGRFVMRGIEVGRGSISQFRVENDGIAVITTYSNSYEPGSLIGSSFKMLDGDADNEVYEIVENTVNSITIRLLSESTLEKIGYLDPISPLGFSKNKIKVEKFVVDDTRFNNRLSMTPLHAGKWAKFVGTGNRYLILGIRVGGNIATLLLDKNVAEEDKKKGFQIVSGIEEGDSFVIYDPAVATIPDRNRSDGIRQSMLVAENAHVEIQFSRFEYFGSHIGNRTRFGKWKRSTAGLAFLNMHLTVISYSEFYQTAAATNILFEDAEDIHIFRNFMADAHPAINPDGALEVGHGWVFQSVHGLQFEDNIVRNMNDDLVYVGRDSTELNFFNNKLISTPVVRGNSANNLEIVSNHDAPEVKIQKNLMINADVNLHVDLRNGGLAEISENLIGSTLRLRSANVVLENVEGQFENNKLLFAPAGAIIMGDSRVNLRPNQFTGHYVAAFRKSNVLRNSWITLRYSCDGLCFGCPHEMAAF